MKTLLRSALLLAASLFALQLISQTLQVELVPFASGFENQTDIVHAGDERLFVVEKAGTIRIVQPDGSVNTTPFLDISNLTVGSGERGLLGMAFHPDYTTNGRFYLNFTDFNGHTQISSFLVSTNDPDVADPSSRVDLMYIEQPYSNHNGGCIRFGPDGYLYIGMGDGGAGGDPQGYGQNINSLLGKMLRIDVDGAAPYSIPADNPFIGQAPLDEIWAIGMRNPWRFSFDSATGDMWIGDVGQSEREEIDFELAGSAGGLNYGWRCREGSTDFNTTGCQGLVLTDPVAEWDHSQGDCSITGGQVYRGSANLDMQGLYFVTDYCSGEFRTVSLDANGAATMTAVSGNEGFGWTCFGSDVNGELYAARSTNGTIYRLIDSDCVNYSATISEDNGLLTATTGVGYQWFIDGVAISGADQQTLQADEQGDYTVGVTSADGCYALSTALMVGEAGCAPDLDGDEVIGITDFVIFNSAFGTPCNGCPSDLDGDGQVGITDFVQFNSAFGSECE